MKFKFNIKNKKARIVVYAAIILLLSLGGYFGYIKYDLYQKELHYQKALKEINKKDWQKALEELQLCEGYKDVSALEDKVISEKRRPTVKTNTLNIDDIVKLIKDGNYESVQTKLVNKDDPTYQALYNYACALQFEKENVKSMPLYYLNKIPSNYNGPLSKEIIQKRNQLQQEENKSRPPQIGMNSTQVMGSAWGTPQHINKTTTTYGTTEQWVYPGFKYVYFENGVVTSIQE